MNNKKMNTKLYLTTVATLIIACAAEAQSAVSLGIAANFGVLSGSTVTNTGFTDVIGDIGVHPGSAITGFFGTVENDGPGTFTGTAHQADSIAAQAKADARRAYTELNCVPVTTTLGVELGGLTLVPGVYVLGSAGLTGTLTLNGGGDYVFQIGDTLNTAALSMVNLVNGASASGVFWAVGTSATLGQNTDFAGTIITDASISLSNGATVDGRLIALSGAVTLISNTISPSLPASPSWRFCCSAPSPGGADPSGKVRPHSSTGIALGGGASRRSFCSSGGDVKWTFSHAVLSISPWPRNWNRP
jgi:hypothetical protein